MAKTLGVRGLWACALRSKGVEFGFLASFFSTSLNKKKAKTRKMSSIGILSSSLTGKNECELCGKSFTQTYSDINALFTVTNRLNVIFALTRPRERISWCHIKKYTPRVLLIKPLTEYVKHPRLNYRLRESISRKKLDNRPTLNAVSDKLHLLNIQDQKTLLIQMIMKNF